MYHFVVTLHGVTGAGESYTRTESVRIDYVPNAKEAYLLAIRRIFTNIKMVSEDVVSIELIGG